MQEYKKARSIPRGREQSVCKIEGTQEGKWNAGGDARGQVECRRGRKRQTVCKIEGAQEGKRNNAGGDARGKWNARSQESKWNAEGQETFQEDTRHARGQAGRRASGPQEGA